MISLVFEQLDILGFDLTPEEIADLLWLGIKMSQNTSETEGQISENDLDVDDEPVDTTTSTEQIDLIDNGLSENSDSSELQTEAEEYSPQESPTKAYLSTFSGTLPPKHSVTFKSPRPSALTNPLELARALRPLMRKHPSYTQTVFDEEETVNRIADEQLWVPVLKPASERWFDLTIVIEDTPSVAIWQETLDEWQRLVTHQGAFRNVRCWRLYDNNINTDNISDRALQDTPKPSYSLSPANNFGASSPRSPKELIEPGGRQLILLISDCVSPLWKQGTIYPLLKTWSRHNSLSILQVLPENYWARSVLGRGQFVHFSSFLPEPKNHRLSMRTQSPWKVPPQCLANSLKLPVITFAAESLRQWSQVMTGDSSVTTAGVIFESPQVMAHAKQIQSFSEISPEEHVRRFFNSASEPACKLASLMAAVPVSLHIARLIQQTLVPGSGHIHLAEVFLSGLIQTVNTSQATRYVKHTQYDFLPEIRPLLLQISPISEVDEVLDQVSTYIAQRVQLSSRNFEALLEIYDQLDEEKRKQVQPFAELTPTILKQLGGIYAEIAEELTPSPISVTANQQLKAKEQKGQTTANEIVNLSFSNTLKQKTNSREDNHVPKIQPSVKRINPTPHKFLTLKPEYRKSFLIQAKSRFPKSHIKGLWRAINERITPEAPPIRSDDTIRRILTMDGHRSLAENVNTVCEFFGEPWHEACIEGDIVKVQPPVQRMYQVPYKFLTLKPKYRRQFLQEAQAKFPRRHIKGLWEAMNELLGPDNIKIRDNTIRRILTIDNHRGLQENVHAVCDFFRVPWYEACLEGDYLSGIDTRIEEIHKKVESALLGSNWKLGSQQFSRKRNSDFIELFLIEVDTLPSEYPPIADPDVLVDRSKLTEEDFDRIGVQLLRGHKREIKDVISDRHNIFIYGDPGSGKTTCLQWIALKCCQGEILPGCAPIFIGARSFSTITKNETLEDRINRIFDQWECSSGERQEILDSGQAAFIFDGVDEIASSEREYIEANIDRLLREYPQCRFIFSSRLGRNFSFSDNFQKTIITPLQKAQIRQFIENWYGQPGKDKTLAAQMLRKLQSKAYSGIRELAQRPVLLDLLCAAFENNADLPRRRFEVLRSGISLMMRKNISIEEGGHSFATLRELDIRNILCNVASHFFLKHQIIFSTQEVERIIQNYYETAYKVERSLVPDRQILQGIEQSSGLLVRWADNFCTFSHLTFQEFFTADNLVRNNRYHEVYEHLEQPRWYFVIGMIAECLSDENLWQFFYELKLKIDSVISENSKLINFLKVVETRANSTVESLESKQPNLETYARAWYFAYALNDTGNITNSGPIYRYFDLPDLEFATSMIDGNILQSHECIYKMHHDFDQNSSTPQAFITALQRLEQSLGNDYQNAEVIRGWQERIRQQRGKFDDLNGWWKNRHDYWKERVSTLMEALHLPCAANLTQEQKNRLHSYYNMTKLFSTCMTRSRLDDLQREEVIESMLSLQSLSLE